MRLNLLLFVVFVSSSSDEKLRPLVRQMVNMFVRLMNDFATSKRSRKIVLVSTFSRFLFFSSSFSFFFFFFLAYFVEVQSRRIKYDRIVSWKSIARKSKDTSVS